MLESTLETQFRNAIKRQQGLALKFTSPGMRGVPDRLVILPKKRIAFVELKQPGKKPTAQQKHRHKQLRALGVPVFVLDHPDQIAEMIREIRRS